jgi:peroxiredoxin
VEKLLNKHFIAFSIFVLLLGLIWIVISADPEAYKYRNTSAPRPGFSAPNFTLPDLNGKQIHLTDFLGKPVLVNFWASWCSPCKSEMPTFQEIYKEFEPQGFVLLTINNRENRNVVQNFITEKALTFPVLLDIDGSISTKYQVDSLPTTVFVGKDGEIKDIMYGGPISEAYLRIQVEELLREVP